jgi:hypothetical protein
MVEAAMLALRITNPIRWYEAASCKRYHFAKLLVPDWYSEEIEQVQ